MKIYVVKCEGLNVVYITLLPPVRVVDKLRERGHPFTLPEYNTVIHKKSFVCVYCVASFREMWLNCFAVVL